MTNYSEDVLKKSVFERELIMIESKGTDYIAPAVIEYLRDRVADIDRRLKERRS